MGANKIRINKIRGKNPAILKPLSNEELTRLHNMINDTINDIIKNARSKYGIYLTN